MIGFLRRLIQLSRHKRFAEKASGTTREALEAAVEWERAQLLFLLTAILNLCFFYGVAGAAWGFVFKVSLLLAIICGVATGLAIAFTVFSYPIFKKLEHPQELSGRQLFIGMWVKLGIILGGLGLIAWLLRMIFSIA